MTFPKAFASLVTLFAATLASGQEDPGDITAAQTDPPYPGPTAFQSGALRPGAFGKGARGGNTGTARFIASADETEMCIIFNKDAEAVLPAGRSKACIQSTSEYAIPVTLPADADRESFRIVPVLSGTIQKDPGVDLQCTVEVGDSVLVDFLVPSTHTIPLDQLVIGAGCDPIEIRIPTPDPMACKAGPPKLAVSITIKIRRDAGSRAAALVDFHTLQLTVTEKTPPAADNQATADNEATPAPN